MTIKAIIASSLLIASALLVVAAPVAAQTAPAANPAPSAAAPPAHYTTAGTDLGTLMEDPASMAVLNKHIPEMFKSEQINQARSMTLKEVAAYAADTLTDQLLASIDADLAKLPPKK